MNKTTAIQPWDRKLMVAYWLVVLVLFMAEAVLGLSGTAGDMLYGKSLQKLLILDLSMLVVMGAAELWLWSVRRYIKQVIVGTIFVLSYMIFILLRTSVAGAEVVLMLPVFVSVFYFHRILLYVTSFLNATLYAFLFFFSPVDRSGREIEFFLMICVFIAGFVMGLAILSRTRQLSSNLKQLIKSEQHLIVEKTLADKLLKIDALTGLYNHKTFHEYLDALLEQCEVNQLRLQLAIIDIDNFKMVNDNYGHWVGDLVLKEVASKINACITPNDFAARYGGEEFAVILTDKETEEAVSIVERLRLDISSLSQPLLEHRPVTVSIGFCNYLQGDGKERLFRSADDALYRAKRSGKNKIVIHEPEAILTSTSSS
ncbi:GGDEF domain-containing protein [Paenibacillus sp. JX-17]|uniref:GGDEF domain-containing protein n=1 Tax=Paenibacillus lacisoli TaxID=3064525 RepID=A0ABT9CFI2_9BACL|nr:GGDEF domain-containing protein [Paenibacillus sp. JX-17]MDO7907404.1 GGDEF domain-containing protein [Paenibacillus sp. JX-17]